MSGIPAWAYRGAKVVLVDASVGRFGNAATHACDEGDICEITNTATLYGHAACQAREVNGKWTLTGDTWSKLTRFRPLVTEQDDLEAHFNQFLTTDHRERV